MGKILRQYGKKLQLICGILRNTKMLSITRFNYLTLSNLVVILLVVVNLHDACQVYIQKRNHKMKRKETERKKERKERKNREREEKR